MYVLLNHVVQNLTNGTKDFIELDDVPGNSAYRSVPPETTTNNLGSAQRVFNQDRKYIPDRNRNLYVWLLSKSALCLLAIL